MLPAAGPIKISFQTEAATCPYLALLFSESHIWSCSTSFDHVQEHFCSGFLLLPPLPGCSKASASSPEYLGFSSPCTLRTGTFQVVSYHIPGWLGHRRALHPSPKNHQAPTSEAGLCRQSSPLQSITGLSSASSACPSLPDAHVYAEPSKFVSR